MTELSSALYRHLLSSAVLKTSQERRTKNHVEENEANKQSSLDTKASPSSWQDKTPSWVHERGPAAQQDNGGTPGDIGAEGQRETKMPLIATPLAR